jgi:hypothetical protein
VKFLQQFDQDGPWCLAAIIPDGTIETRTFEPGDEPRMQRWIDRHKGESNLYFTVNRVRDRVDKKPTKNDIKSAGALHVDVDVKNGSDAQAERTAILERLRGFDPPPTVIVDSGGGYQAFWHLDKFRKVKVAENVTTLEDYNRGIARAGRGFVPQHRPADAASRHSESAECKKTQSGPPSCPCESRRSALGSSLFA